MKVNHIKQLFVALLLLLSAGTATAAQWHLAKTTLNAAGSKDTLTLEVSGNSFSFSSFQVDFTLPDGVLLDGTPILGELAGDHALTWTKRTDDSFRCVAYSAKNTEMKAPEGTVIRIPVVLAANFTDGDFTAKNGILSNKKSLREEIDDLSVTLNPVKEKSNLEVTIEFASEQVVNSNGTIDLSYKTNPSNIKLETSLYKDAACTIDALEKDRKQEGTLYVKFSYTGDVYNELEYVYAITLIATPKISIKVDVPPTALPIKKGQSLQSAQLTGGKVLAKNGEDFIEVRGVFQWKDVKTKPVSAGTQSYQVEFIPENSIYETKSLSVDLEVKETYMITTVGSTGGVTSVLGKTDDNLYVEGQQISLKALCFPNFQFDEWTIVGKDGSVSTNDSIGITVKANQTYYANFSPIRHKVLIEKEGNGTLSVTTVEGIAVTTNEFLQQGTVLLISANLGMNAQLKSLTVNSNPLEGDKVTLTEALTVRAEFEPKQVENALITIVKPDNGSILLYKEDGSPIASGTTVPKPTKIRVITLPDAGYQKGSVSLPVGTDGLYTVNGDVTATASFVAKTYKVTTSAVNSLNEKVNSQLKVTGADDLNNVKYGTSVNIDIVRESGANLYALLINGEEQDANRDSWEVTVTGDLYITGIFNKKVDITREYILWPYQEYYYNGVSRNFVPFASQTYAGFSFDVSYIYKEGETEIPTKTAIDANEYNVVVHRDADGLYNMFEEVYEKGLVIKKSKIAVTEAPKSHGADPGTRPGSDLVSIEHETKDNVTTYKITPKGDALKNYEGMTIYYYSTKDPVKFSLGSGTPLLRLDDGAQSGGVKITNGGLPCDLNEIREGVTILLEAVAPTGQKFVEWSDKNTDNPREYVVAGDVELTPKYAPKDDFPACGLAQSSEYSAGAQIVDVKGSDASCQISFYLNETDCDNKLNQVVLKDPGLYYVRVDRPEDKKYKAYKQVFLYTIERAAPNVTWPTASVILSGQKLSESVLQGGHAGIVAGTFAWSNPNQVITEKGEQEVVFTPIDPNYKPVTHKVEVNVISATSSSTDPETPVTPVDPVDPENPDVPTGVESIEDGLSLYTANQSIFVNTPQQVTLTVVDVAGSVIYEGKVQGEVEIPVGHTGVYFLKFTAVPDTSFVKKIVVR